MMQFLPQVLLVHAGATWFMTGLIWFVQVVHYPLMARVGPAQWPGYESAHQRRTTWIVAPAMLIEAATAVLALVLLHGGAGDGPGGRGLPEAWMAAALLGVVWASTFGLQVPLHGRLAREFGAGPHRLLTATNWIRTIAWSGRAVLAGAMLWRAG